MSEGIRPTSSLRADVNALIRELVGVNKAAIALGIGREATARIAAGLGVRRGTMNLAEQALKKRGSKTGKVGKKGQR